jgi:hypothetical protein
MNIEEALNRINWRFKNESVKINESKIIINQKDIEAVNFLIDWVNRQKQNEIKENILFAKLFVYNFTNEIIYNNGNPQDALHRLQEIAKKPIQQHYDKFHEYLNIFEQTNYMKSIGIDFDKHPALMSKEEKNKEAKLLNEKQIEIVKKIKNSWNLEEVYRSLNNTITEYFNRYKNYN